MKNDAISKHFKLNSVNLDLSKVYSFRRKSSTKTNSFDYRTSREKSYGYHKLNKTSYCAVDYYDQPIEKHTYPKFPTPVRKQKEDVFTYNNCFFSSEQKYYVSTRKFDGYLPRESPPKEKKRVINNQMIQQMYQQKLCEEKRLQQYLQYMCSRQAWNNEPKVQKYERCRTPQLLKHWKQIKPYELQ